jgi:phosphinothricin acetyltransferase
VDIYNYYVRNTTVTFNLHELSEEEFENDFYHTGGLSGIYTITEDGSIIGFGCISRFNRKEAYDRSAYVSIYLKPGNTGKGLGGGILDFLEETAYKKGKRSLIALICKENTSSASLFTKKGYVLAGELKEAGEKFGRLLDVVYYQKNF